MEYAPSDRLYLEDDLGVDVAWLLRRIHDDPSLLSVSDAPLDLEDAYLSVRANSITVLLNSDDAGVRHVVEVKLSDADVEQVVRALELWLVEQQRHPEAEHQPSVVAEHIPPTVSRAVLMAQAIAPMGAFELHALQVGDALAMHTEPVEAPAIADPQGDSEIAVLLADAMERVDPRGAAYREELQARLIGGLKRPGDASS
ncbi:hypothetical protein [Sinomonas albida]|uniref:hypothetical protein n=1 Tax=Sinomonas albida TaxID=369942 RepID=UPI003018770E